MSTATDTKTITFLSKCPNLTLTKVPVLPRYSPQGLKIGSWPGERIEFQGHHFKTDDPELIEWLREHRNYNSPANNGFWEDGNAPDEPKPTIAEQHEAIEAAVDARDLEALAAVVELEQGTHNRDVILSAARIAAKALGAGETPTDDV